MTTIREMAAKRSEYVLFDPRKIQVKPGLNSRDMDAVETKDWVAEIKESIKARGFLSSRPLEIFQEGETVYVSAGHCRLAAVMLAISEGIEIKTVPCLIEPKGKDAVDRKLDQITDNDGRRLTLLEAGKSIKFALANGWSIDDVAKHLGKSRSYVDQALGFQEADPEIKAAVKAGEISASLAAQIAREEPSEQAVETVKAAVREAKASGKGKATRKHVEKVTARSKAKALNAASKPDNEVVIKKEGPSLVSVKFGDRERIIMSHKEWLKIAQQITTTMAQLFA